MKFRTRKLQEADASWRQLQKKTDASQRRHQHELRRRRDDMRLFMWNVVKRSAKKRGLLFTIEPTDLLILQVCPVTKRRFVFDPKHPSARHDAPSVDRIDSSLGYIPGNVAVISRRANALKSNATVEEMRRLLWYMRRASEGVFSPRESSRLPEDRSKWDELDWTLARAKIPREQRVLLDAERKRLQAEAGR